MIITHPVFGRSYADPTVDVSFRDSIFDVHELLSEHRYGNSNYTYGYVAARQQLHDLSYPEEVSLYTVCNA